MSGTETLGTLVFSRYCMVLPWPHIKNPSCTLSTPAGDLGCWFANGPRQVFGDQAVIAEPGAKRRWKVTSRQERGNNGKHCCFAVVPSELHADPVYFQNVPIPSDFCFGRTGSCCSLHFYNVWRNLDNAILEVGLHQPPLALCWC